MMRSDSFLTKIVIRCFLNKLMIRCFLNKGDKGIGCFIGESGIVFGRG